MMNRVLPCLVSTLMLVACSGRAPLEDSGLDLSARDLTVRPGNDFYAYANGTWLRTEQIPPDRSVWGSFTQLADDAESKLRMIVESLPASAPAGSTQQKVGDFYRAYLDTQTIERLGLAPAQPGLDAISAARSYEDIARLFGRPDLNLAAPLDMSIGPDPKNPDRYAVFVAQAGLGLPNRDYYLKSGAPFSGLRDKYAAHIERTLALAEVPDAAARAKSILDLETRIAQIHWPAAKRRERDLTYNPRTRAQLAELAPGFAWREWLDAAGLANQPEYVLRELDAIANLSKLFRQIPVESWRSYLTYHYLASVSDVLPSAFDAEHFDFYGHALNGQPTQRERWKRAVRATDANIGEALGQLYVERYFPPESKRKVLALVENLRAAYAHRIEHVAWMSADTRKAALEKLAAFRPKIGYPDKWRDYSALEVRAGDAFGNAVRAKVFDWQRRVARLGRPTDRDEWGMTPQTVNAYYNSTFNAVVFPAAILQPPFFDPDADAAVNYGGIGAVIGHEMGHGFDDQGAKSDARGVLRTWWQPQDEQAFEALVDRLARQYDGYSPLQGLNVNGRLTLGENIGDLGGMNVAYEAYHLSLRGRAAPVQTGLTGDQRFFLSQARIWRSLNRDEQVRAMVLSNPHSPPKFRVNGVVRNMDAWYAAFDVKPGDALYLPPADRVRIW